MEIILNSVNAILPLFVMGAIGYAYNRFKGISDETIASWKDR